jgi:hypothetical protein
MSGHGFKICLHGEGEEETKKGKKGKKTALFASFALFAFFVSLCIPIKEADFLKKPTL